MPDADNNTTNHRTQNLMRLEQILDLIPVGRTTFYRWIKDGKAPPPIKAGSRISLWRRSEIEAMMRRWEDGRNGSGTK